MRGGHEGTPRLGCGTNSRRDHDAVAVHWYWVRAERRAEFARLKDTPAFTRDGAKMTLLVNAGLAVDLDILPETGAEGKLVRKVYVEAGSDIGHEYYLSMLIDRETATVAIMFSSEGGMDIEEVAAHAPEKILTTHFDPHQGVGAYQARRLGFAIGLSAPQVANFVKAVQAMARTFLATDADMLEVNPLVVTASDALGSAAGRSGGERISTRL